MSARSKRRMEDQYCSQHRHAGNCKADGCHYINDLRQCRAYTKNKKDWGCKNWNADSGTIDDPISLEPIRLGNNIIKMEGNCYQHETLCKWLQHNRTSPLTRLPASKHVLKRCGLPPLEEDRQIEPPWTLQEWRERGYHLPHIPVQYDQYSQDQDFDSMDYDYDNYDDYEDYDNYFDENFLGETLVDKYYLDPSQREIINNYKARGVDILGYGEDFDQRQHEFELFYVIYKVNGQILVDMWHIPSLILREYDDIVEGTLFRQGITLEEWRTLISNPLYNMDTRMHRDIYNKYYLTEQQP